MLHYLVKWRSYPESENSWEPQANLVGSEAMIAAYERELNGVDETDICRKWYQDLERGDVGACMHRLIEV